ncbi:MAG: mobile mystery protein A [Pseudomonadales bacterium]
MKSNDRILARRQLDKRLDTLRQSTDLAQPPRGWIRAIREALGMTTQQLGNRLGVSQPRITHMEQAETSGSIKLETLQRAANALECELVYAFVPRQSLQEMMRSRATKQAQSILDATAHSMTLEDQLPDAETQEILLQELIAELTDRAGSSLWDDE